MDTWIVHYILTVKFWVIVVFVVSAVYIHYRGKMRLSVTRQLGDHSTFMAQINVFMYLFSKVPDTPYLPREAFPELKLLRDNWQIIQQEAAALLEAEAIGIRKGYDDIGFNSFFRSGWKRFYLKWYQKEPHPSAKQLCPNTVALLEKVPSIKAAIFSQLSPGGKLVRHRDPYAGSLRYHLGLITPNSDGCSIIVDGQPYSWRDGEDVIFDETYLHYAYNHTDKNRVILFCDVKRPMRYWFAEKVNQFFSYVIMAAASSPNEEGDKTGWLNKIFKYVYAIRRLGKRIKAWNRKVYYLIKYALFIAILYLIFR
jgi:beta-hydroxylase